MNNDEFIEKPELPDLPKVKDRMSFIYLEHCNINREDGAIRIEDLNGITNIPAAAITVIMLGPGTTISHRAMELIGDVGVGVVWVGERGVRYYAHGRALSSNSKLLLRQAEMVTNVRKHALVVRRMYHLRYPDEKIDKLTVQQLRGREGNNVRSTYRRSAKQYDIPWDGREYDPEDFYGSDPVNQALSASNVCLYGLAHAVIVALGCSVGMGFVHVGREKSFAYDIADLYKAEITIPLSFQLAGEYRDGDDEFKKDFPNIVRRRTRDAIVKSRLLERMVHDIKYLLSDGDNFLDDDEATVDLYLWDNVHGKVKSGVQYHDDETEEDTW